MIFASVLISTVMICLPTSLSAPFPEVLSLEHVNVRLRNVGSKRYLSVIKNRKRAYELSTKSMANLADPEVDFSLYFFTSAEAGEIKLGLIKHQDTGTYISMSRNKNVHLSMALNHDPLALTTADNRFFIMHKMGDYFAFNYLSDDDFRHKYFLAVNGSNVPVFKKFKNLTSYYPEDILFSIEELDGY